MTLPHAPRARPRWLAAALLWGGLVVLGLLAGRLARAPDLGLPQGVRPRPRIPGPPADLPTLLWQLGVGSVVWYGVVLALPLLRWSARHIDVEHRGRGRVVVLATLVLLALVAASATVDYLLTYGGATVRPGATAYVTVALRQHLLPWVVAFGVVAVLEARRRAAHAALERERLRAQVAEQRLIALTGQLQPHFLFNTLQGISTLIHRDPEAADEMLAKLAELLRELLRHRDRVLVPLGDELRFARTYLEISKLRFADRLAFELEAPSDLHALAVPLFILQPLVENAIAHGIGGRLRGGRVTLIARREGDTLVVEVADDGAGLPATAPPRDGVGLENTRERLRASFGAAGRLALTPRAEGGTVARLELPARPLVAAGVSA